VLEKSVEENVAGGGLWSSGFVRNVLKVCWELIYMFVFKKLYTLFFTGSVPPSLILLPTLLNKYRKTQITAILV